MSRTGIDFPCSVDLVTNGDEFAVLILIETRPLVNRDALALQEKLNNYLSFALDGGLAAKFPACAGKPACIRVDLYSQPDEFILEFLRKFASFLVEHGVSLEVNINGMAVA
jgi:hypothetical protein